MGGFYSLDELKVNYKFKRGDRVVVTRTHMCIDFDNKHGDWIYKGNTGIVCESKSQTPNILLDEWSSEGSFACSENDLESISKIERMSGKLEMVDNKIVKIK